MFHKHLEINHQPQTLENNMSNFKAGDKVYYPLRSTEVLTIRKSNAPVYPILVTKHDFTFTIDGKLLSTDTAPCLIPATPENHELLEKLYDVEFEKPPSNEITELPE